MVIKPRQKIWFLTLLLIIIALACSMPGITQVTPPPPTTINEPGITVQETIVTATPTLHPTATLQPLPPTLVDVEPSPGTNLPLQPNFTFFFNEPMDKPSVELALSGQPFLSGRFTWLDDATLSFEQDSPLTSGSELTIHISTSALALNGQFLEEPISLHYKVAPPLKVAQLIPEPGQTEVDSTSAIVASFNQPVVSIETLPVTSPEVFSITPKIAGTGKWINKSTYIFYPEHAMAGGVNYRVELNPQLSSIYGGAFEGRTVFEIDPFEWSFDTALPRILSISPGDGATSVGIDTEFHIEFNQPMDRGSVEENFIITDSDNNVLLGVFNWNDDSTTLAFIPANQLNRETTYKLALLGTAQTSGGTSIGFDTVARIKTVPEFKVIETFPANKGTKQPQANVLIHFNSPGKQVEEPFQFVDITPGVDNSKLWWGDFNQTLNIQGDFQPLSTYTVTISDSFSDLYGASIGEPYTFTFRTAALNPALEIANGMSTLSLRPEDSKINARVTNIDQVDIRLANIPFQDLVDILAPGSFDLYQDYQPPDPFEWTQDVQIPGDKIYAIQLPLSPNGQVLDTGIYYLTLNASEIENPQTPNIVLSTNVHLTFKLSTTSAFIWATDLRTMEPVRGVSVTIYDSDGVQLASGSTDEQGIFQSPISTQPDLHNTYYAVMAEPGDELFSLCLSYWSYGIEGRDFGIATDFSAPSTTTFLYTDQLIYQPGQPVYFRGVVRHQHNGRYALPGLETIPLTVFDSKNNPIEQLNLRINEFGTIHGEFLLANNADPGTYRLETIDNFITFEVKEFQESAIQIVINGPEGLIAGEEINIAIGAQYAINAPVIDVPISWKIHRTAIRLELPGFQVGMEPLSWLKEPLQEEPSPASELVASGESMTNSEGKLVLSIPTENETDVTYRYTLEIEQVDGSDYPAQGDAYVVIHPGDTYVGLRPDKWVSKAGNELGFDVLTVDWDYAPMSNVPLTASFQEVTWTQSQSPDLYETPLFTPTFRTISSADLITGQDGRARLSFTPPSAGIYQLMVSGFGIETSILIWVDGPDPVTWPILPNNHIKLTSDKQSYLPGNSATIFIPNPFGSEAMALITNERDEILRYDIIHLEQGGTSYSLTLTEQDTPNIYFSVAIIGKNTSGKPDFREGYLNLKVQPVEKELVIHVDSPFSSSKEKVRFNPGEGFNLNIKITDYEGKPVQGEFSLQLTALNPITFEQTKNTNLLTELYGEQPLGIRTGMTLAIDSLRWKVVAKEENSIPFEVNHHLEQFPNTIFWQGDILTDNNGEANLTLSLPDFNSIYQLQVQAVSATTSVGYAQDEWDFGNGLFLVPRIPDLLRVGDHTELATEIHNETTEDLLVEISLQTNGFILDQIEDETQEISIPSDGSALVKWKGYVLETTDLDLLLSASGAGFQTSVRIGSDDLQISKYSDPYTFSKAGILDVEDECVEVISLPESLDSTAVQLEITLSPSLAAAMTDGLDFLENYPYRSTDQVLSSFLPNLIAYRTLQDLGLEVPSFSARLERTMTNGIQELALRQNEDGGWDWWSIEKDNNPDMVPVQTSDSTLSAYILFGLSKAVDVDISIDEEVIERGRNYLLATLPTLEMLSSNWQLDQLAFHYLVLAMTGEGVTNTAKDFFEIRDQLSPYAEAFLALTLAKEDPGDTRIDTILSDLEFSAIENQKWKYWEGRSIPVNLDTPIMNTAIVLYTLAQFDPASPLIPDALNYLMTQRQSNGSWGSPYETAWTLLALTEVMKGIGELSGDFAFSASLNGEQVIEGQAGGNTRLNSISAIITKEKLNAEESNGLIIQRSAGPGRLYYLTNLDIALPFAKIEDKNHGIYINRTYQIPNERIQPTVGDLVTVRITLILENNAHHLFLQDNIPAGAKILRSKTQSLYEDLEKCGASSMNCYLPETPFSNGWGWWQFTPPSIDGEQILWAADYLPAGVYELTYIMVLTHPGEYQVPPTQAWQVYLTEVFGNSPGSLFTIQE